MSGKTIAITVAFIFLLIVCSPFLLVATQLLHADLDARRIAPQYAAMQSKVSSLVRAGSTRQEAEARLRTANIPFERSLTDYVVRGFEDTSTDDVYVGTVAGVFPCGDSQVHVEIVFLHADGTASPLARPGDKVQAIRRQQISSGCL